MKFVEKATPWRMIKRRISALEIAFVGVPGTGEVSALGVAEGRAFDLRDTGADQGKVLVVVVGLGIREAVTGGEATVDVGEVEGPGGDEGGDGIVDHVGDGNVVLAEGDPFLLGEVFPGQGIRRWPRPDGGPQGRDVDVDFGEREGEESFRRLKVAVAIFIRRPHDRGDLTPGRRRGVQPRFKIPGVTELDGVRRFEEEEAKVNELGRGIAGE